MLNDGTKKVLLNTTAAPYVCEVQDAVEANITRDTEKKKGSKVLEKLEKDVAKAHNNNDNKVENENE